MTDIPVKPETLNEDMDAHVSDSTIAPPVTVKRGVGWPGVLGTGLAAAILGAVGGFVLADNADGDGAERLDARMTAEREVLIADQDRRIAQRMEARLTPELDDVNDRVRSLTTRLDKLDVSKDSMEALDTDAVQTETAINAEAAWLQSRINGLEARLTELETASTTVSGRALVSETPTITYRSGVVSRDTRSRRESDEMAAEATIRDMVRGGIDADAEPKNIMQEDVTQEDATQSASADPKPEPNVKVPSQAPVDAPRDRPTITVPASGDPDTEVPDSVPTITVIPEAVIPETKTSPTVRPVTPVRPAALPDFPRQAMIRAEREEETGGNWWTRTLRRQVRVRDLDEVALADRLDAISIQTRAGNLQEAADLFDDLPARVRAEGQEWRDAVEERLQ